MFSCSIPSCLALFASNSKGLPYESYPPLTTPPPMASLHSLMYLDLPSTDRLVQRGEQTSTNSGGVIAAQLGFSFCFWRQNWKNPLEFFLFVLILIGSGDICPTESKLISCRSESSN